MPFILFVNQLLIFWRRDRHKNNHFPLGSTLQSYLLVELLPHGHICLFSTRFQDINRVVPNCIRSSSSPHRKRCSQVKHSPGGRSFIWPTRVCAAEQGMVEQMSFGLEAFQRVWRLAMSGLHLQYQEPMAIPINFFLNIYFQEFSVKNYLILYAKQSKSGSQSICLLS